MNRNKNRNRGSNSSKRESPHPHQGTTSSKPNDNSSHVVNTSTTSPMINANSLEPSPTKGASTSLEPPADTISLEPLADTHPVSSAVADQKSREATQLGKTSENAQTVSALTSSKGAAYHKHSSDHTDDNGAKSIDICPQKHGVPKLKPSLFERNKEKRKELQRSKDDLRPTCLRPGMILLKSFISHADQVKIIKKCRELGLGSGGFYKPGYDDGAKLRLHMMCLGKNWDPQKRSYEDFRSIDGEKPPTIPEEFKKLVSDAIQASRQEDRVRNPNEAIPLMEPDICIVNFYTNTGKLGLHQDRDESAESIKKGLPVVSFSIGDSAEFLYGDDREEEKAEKVELKTGDVLIFGGKSRLIFHGVPSIIPNSALKFLADEANLRPGRLNLTFRKY